MKAIISASVKSFFDPLPVTKAVTKAKRKVHTTMGRYVRTAARSSIRPVSKKATRTAQLRFGPLGTASSSPGTPPFSHTGVLKKFIIWSLIENDSVIVGAMKTNQVFFDGDGKPVTGTVPSILEEGGSIRILQVYKRKYGERPAGWFRADLRSRRRLANLRTRLHTVTIKARPYMKPALDQEMPKMAQLWLDSVK